MNLSKKKFITNLTSEATAAEFWLPISLTDSCSFSHFFKAVSAVHTLDSIKEDYQQNAISKKGPTEICMD